MPKDNRISEMFTKADGQRSQIMERARKCAALSKPWYLPPLSQTPDTRMPENYQSLGSRGVTNLEGRMVLALFPPEVPWLHLTPAPSIRYDPRMPPEMIQEIEARLYVHEMFIQATLESASLSLEDDRDVAGFRTVMRQAIGHVLVTGDTLLRLGDDYRLTNYGRPQYVTKRDPQGRVLWHVVKESVDIQTLTEEQRQKAAFDADRATKDDPTERMVDLYTCVEWMPQDSMWRICQETNGKIIVESWEPVSPYFAVPFDLPSGEDYGRGFIEQNLGDLRSLDELRQRLLEFAALASKHLLVRDYRSQTRDEDYAKDTGSVILGRVDGGQVQDAAFFKADKLADFKVCYDTATLIERGLGSAMLIQSEAVRDSERTTAYEVAKVTIAEVEGALGGFYAPTADRFQIPIARRTIYQLTRDRMLPPLPKGAVELRTLTGIAALVREQKALNLLTFAEVARNLGPQALARINGDVFLDVYARYRQIDEAGLIKTPEQVKAEAQSALRLQGAAQAQEKAVDVLGNVAQAALTPQAA